MSALAMFDDRDLPFIASLVDVLVRAEGEPWRIGFAQLERVLCPVAPNRATAVTAALQRLAGGRKRYATIARHARGLVLGVPVFADADRLDRLRVAARTLGIIEHELEVLLWSDLPRERAIELPGGRPSELEVAALANVHLIQRALRRAQTVRLRIWGDDGSLLRAATGRGLLATAARGNQGETVLEIVGPLSLFHRTSVYGRVLAQLVPMLAACDRFELVLECETGTASYTSTLASPVLLPLAPFDRSGSYLASRLARDLEQRDPTLSVRFAPPPLVAGSSLVCPDLVIDDTWFVEIVGFWTAAYVDRKLARYRDAGIVHVILCIDETRGCADDAPPAQVVGFTKRVDAAAILARIAA